MEEFEKLIQQYEAESFYQKGEKIKGKIIKIQDDKAYIDIGQKIEAVIPVNQIEGYKEGDEIIAIFTGKKDKDGYFILSRKGIDIEEKIKFLKEAFEKKYKLRGEIEKVLEKGYIVDIKGLKAFMPKSESSLNKEEQLFENMPVEFYIINLNTSKKYPKIIVSRKKVLEEERKAEKEKLLSLIKEGQIIKGKVVKITDKGAVINIDNIIYAFLPKHLISWDKNKTLEPNQEIEAIVKEKKEDKIIVSMKDLEPNPYEKFNIGDIVEVQIKEINKYGLIVVVDNAEGFIPASHTSHFGYNMKKFQIGQKIKAKIIELDKEKGQLKLSIKELEENPVEKFLKENPVGSIIKAKLKSVKNKIAFIDLGEIEGILRLEDAIFGKEVKDLNSILKPNQIYKFKIIGTQKDKIIVGLKQVKEEAWNEFIKNHKIGDVIEAEVKKLIDKGAFVDINEDIEGFIPVSEIAIERINIPSDKLSLHQKVKAKIIDIDEKNKKIKLSIKALLLEEKKKEEEKKKQEEVKEKLEETKKVEGLGTLGDILKQKLGDKK